MKILLTGVAGFIGSYAARNLIAKGHSVIGIDNFDNFYSSQAKDFNLDLIRYSVGQKLEKFDEKIIKTIADKLNEFNGFERVEGDFKFREVDITDFAAMADIFSTEKIDAVVHLAAMAGVPHSIEEPRKYTHVNVDGTVNILELCAKHKVNNFVFASTSSVYGNCLEVPFHEDQNVDLAISPYAATKRMCEIIDYTYHHIYKINVMNLRFFTVYGPLQRPYGMAIQKFIKQVYKDLPMTIYGDGSMARDYTYIDDITAGIAAAVEKNNGYNVVNLGNKDSVTLNRLSEIVKKQMGRGEVKNVDCPPTEVTVTYADVSRAKEILGYEPHTSIEEGVRRQAEIFNLMPDWYKDLEI